jgi:hypothetical protein
MSESLDGWVERQLTYLDQLSDLEREAVERARMYPGSFYEYSKLPFEKRLAAAVIILDEEVPNCSYDDDRMPANPFTYDITQLTTTDAEKVEAQVAYSEGIWTDTADGKNYTKLPNVKIFVRTTDNHRTTTAEFVELEVSEYDKATLADLNADLQMTFRVTGVGPNGTPTANFEDPLFVTVSKILDIGVRVLYRDRLFRRIKLLNFIKE